MKSDYKFVCNYYCFYKFVLYERGLVYVFNVVFNDDWRKRYKINRGMLVKN